MNFIFGNFLLIHKKFIIFIREFVIMYRKIIFIIFLTIQIDMTIKATVLLSLSFLSLVLILSFKPFVLQNLNILEFKSNFAALIALFVGNLYISEISDLFKAICFVMIILINTWFFLSFLFDIIFLFFHVNYEKFNKFSPKLTITIANFLLKIEQFSVMSCLKYAIFNYMARKLFNIKKIDSKLHSTNGSAQPKLWKFSLYPAERKTKILAPMSVKRI